METIEQNNNTPMTFALSLAQMDIYLDQSRYPNSPMYNVGGYIRIGQVDLARLRQAHIRLVQSHDVFALRIRSSADGVQQYLAQTWDVLLPLVDLSDSQMPQQSARQWLAQWFESSMTIEDSQLYKAAVIKLDDDNYWYAGFAHHLIMDGWGFANWARWLGRYYNEFQSQQASSPSWQDIVQQDEQYLLSDKYVRAKEYWRDQLGLNAAAIVTEQYAMPLDGPQSARHCIALSEAQYHKIKAFADGQQVGLAQVFLGLCASYFCSAYQLEQLVFGVSSHNRCGFRQKQMPGVFTTISPLRIAPAKGLNFIELLCQIQTTQKRNFRHQRYPLGHLIQDSKRAGHNLSEFDFSFNYLKLDSQLSFETGTADLVYLSNHHQKTPLTLTVWEYGAQDAAHHCELQLDFNLRYFHPQEANLLGERLLHHLFELIGSAHRPIEQVSILPPQEVSLLVNELNNTQAQYPSEYLIPQLFEAQARTKGDAVAVVGKGSDGMMRSISYRQLNCRSNQLAHYLREQRLAVGDKVGVCMSRSPELIVAIMAILKAGGVFVPLDANYPEARLGYMIKDSAIGHLITEQALSLRLQSVFSAHLVILDSETTAHQLALYAEQNPEFASPQASVSPAYVIYTSGSTGEPKGVECTHNGVVNCMSHIQQLAPLNSPVPSLLWSSVSFDVSVLEIMSALLYGHALHVTCEQTRMPSEVLFDYMTQADIECAFVPPFMVKDFVIWLRQQTKRPPLKRLVVGVESLLLQDLHEISQLLPDVVVLNGYGPSEATICSSFYRIDKRSKTPQEYAPIGRPISNTQLLVLDKNRKLVPLGCRGELYIGGDCLALGYFNNAEQTQARFVANPYSDAVDSRLYRTGDVVRYLPVFDGFDSVDGGNNLTFLGRSDDQIKLHGLRIEPAEISAKLQNHEWVKDALVILQTDRQSKRYLVAYVITTAQAPAIEHSALAEQLRFFLRRNLPEHMVPASLVVVDSWPLTKNGKVDKQALPQGLVSSGETAHVTAETEMEKLLVELTAPMLELPPQHISVVASFFELGGNSLVLTRLIFMVNQRLNLNLELSNLYGANNIRTMATVVDELLATTKQNSQNQKTMII